MFSLVNLTGRKIMVTGASSGIGRETAILLSKLGAQVILVARRGEELEKTLSMLEKKDGHCFYEFDLSQVEEIEKLAEKVVDNVGKIDGIAFCAGISGSYPLKNLDNKRLEHVTRVNFESFVETVRCFTKKNRFNEGMRIVAVSSVSAHCAAKALTSYAASKAAMEGAVRCMAYELADKSICINTVAPSMIMTDMNAEYLCDKTSEGYKKVVSRQYLGIGETRDVANGIAFLISPAARFITGICLTIDGGYTSI